jgi:hypothetical protein
MEYELAFYRLKRALHHQVNKDHPLAPAACDGCKEVALFLTQPRYEGNADYPVGVDFERPW